MRRISVRSRKRKRAAVLAALFIAAAVLCLVLRISFRTDSPEKNKESSLSLGNIVSEAYAGLKLNEWNPADKEISETAEQIEPTAESTETENSGAKPYPVKWILDTDTSVLRTTLTGYSGKKIIALENGSLILNNTSVENNTLLSESTLSPAFKISVNEKPQVLIMHTHTTESYEPYVRDNFDTSFNYRTTDESMNVTAVGNAIAEKLESAGIAYIHDTTIHDYPSYTGAYERSSETVKALLEEYPSIKVVLDIHRDAIGTDNTITQPIVEINGKEAAQIMIISGCDDGTMGMPEYMFNFRFACRLQEQTETMYPGLTRPVLFDYRKYNQNLTTGSLLIEVGSHGNTIEQAVYSGALFGDALAQVLLDLH